MKFSKEMDQALRSLGDLAQTENSLSARDISVRQNIPYEKISKILQRLSSARVVDSRKGRQGGYVLLKPLGQLSLLELHEALGESTDVTPCSRGKICPSRDSCGIKAGLGQFQEDLNRLLRNYSVEDITGAVL